MTKLTELPQFSSTNDIDQIDEFILHDFSTNLTKRVNLVRVGRKIKHAIPQSTLGATGLTLEVEYEGEAICATTPSTGTTVTITIPDSAFVSPGAQFHIIQEAPSTVTVTIVGANSNVLIKPPELKLASPRGLNSPVTLWYRGFVASKHVWHVWGDLKDAP